MASFFVLLLFFVCLFVCLFLLQKFRAAVLKLYESEHGLTTEWLKIFLFKRFLFYFSCTSLT